MVAILVVAHGTLGESLIQSATHVLGQRPPRLRNVGVSVRDVPETVLRRVQSLIQELDDGSGVLVLSDICGATPCNIVTRLIIPGRVEVVTGASLPMLVRALTYRNEPLATVVAKALSGGNEGVIHLASEAVRATKTG
jgi:PTS system ascorbate-specific IIA component